MIPRAAGRLLVLSCLWIGNAALLAADAAPSNEKDSGEKDSAAQDSAAQAQAIEEGTEPSAADLEFFEKKVRPLLHMRCYECHSQQAKTVQGGLYVDSRQAVYSGGDSGAAVVPGKVEESLLISAVHYGSDSYQMPPEGKLPPEEIALLESWVRRGAPFPAGPEAVERPENAIDWEEARGFWSFRPLRRSDVAVKPGSLEQDFLEKNRSLFAPQRRIDSFIHVALAQRGLTPSPEADRRVLIRRLTFDLIGLPPTPAEVQSFVSDRSPEAYEKLVDRLLASPHYGERWARFWLDLARYTDATASWLDSTAQAHLYRDWVVAAMNRDLPYDQLVLRQLATDMLPETGPEDLPALGFLGLSPTYWKELQLPPEIIKVIVADEWEERIDAVSRTFLGLTVACARCHDHKFDPVTTEDYYALAGVFASTRLDAKPVIDERLYAPVRKAKAEVAKLEAEIKKLEKQKPQPQEKIDQQKAEIRRIKESTPHFDVPLANVVSDASLFVRRKGDSPQSGTRLEYQPQARDLHLFIRGNPNRLGEVVPRRFLTVLSSGRPKPFTKGSGRLELAQAILTEARPLAARVIVNRVWLAHFGSGLVDTPSNFGQQGARPSHPELLDDLAWRFIENGWSLKWLHRELVNSATYRQSSADRPKARKIDADDRYLWRMPRRRLEVEAWRDAILAASGQLQRSLGGPAMSLADESNRRRTLYGTIHRRDMPKMLQIHDFPDPTAHSPRRVNTTTALQGLYVLNSPLLMSQAKALAARVQAEVPGDRAGQVRRAYMLLFGRPATDEELRLAADFLAAGDDAWPQYAQVLLGCNEFIFVD